MKRIILVVSATLLSIIAFCQETIVRWESQGYGLYNNRTSRWVTQRIYQEMTGLGTYAGIYFYSAKKNNLYGVITEKGKTVVDFQFEYIRGFNNGFLGVKRDGSCGLADVYNHLIIPCKYKWITIGSNGAVAGSWQTNQSESWRMDQLVEIRNKLRKEDQELKAQKESEEKEKAFREKKEKELSSFTEYARAFVEPRINAWQHKGEFEKLADYQKRVTGPNRSAMIDSLTRVAEKNYISEHAALHPEYEHMKLDIYDSENEVFFIESTQLGKMVVPVPINDGPDFKAHFYSSMEKKNPVFYIENDKIALVSLDFYDKTTHKTYHFNNSQALTYNHYNLDPDTYTFDLVSVVTAKPADVSAANTGASPKRPVVNILSPAKNATFSDPNVTIRYQATVFDGSTPKLHVWVNGMESDVVPGKQGTQKGVSADWKEVMLTLPKDRDHQCNIMLAITDGSGYSSENKTISLKYIGELPKPKLHLFSVGVSNYSSPSLTKLGYASKDARDFVSTISASDISMYDRIATTMILTDDDATKSNIERNLAALTKTVEQDDVVMLFFSGHGVLDGEDAYFMSSDAVSDNPYTGVDFALIRKIMTKMKDKKCRVLIFMDACYSGAMFNTKSALKNITFADNDIIGFYSSTAGQTSAEFKTDKNGLFTKALIEGLKGEAKNQDKEITTIGLQKYISEFVSTQSGGAQSPIVENKLGDVILFRIK